MTTGQKIKMPLIDPQPVISKKRTPNEQQYP
jgi:hypothetical protein